MEAALTEEAKIYIYDVTMKRVHATIVTLEKQ